MGIGKREREREACLGGVGRVLIPGSMFSTASNFNFNVIRNIVQWENSVTYG